MELDVAPLLGSPLFAGISPEELTSLGQCLQFQQRAYSQGSRIFAAGEPVRHLFLLESGAVQIQKDDYLGNRSIVARIAPGDLFGESFALAGGEVSLYDAVAAQDSTVLLTDLPCLQTLCPQACPCHTQVLLNLLRLFSARNRLLAQKIDCLSRRTTREKLISYLSNQARLQGSTSFDIPFTRQQLADYLAVERSAMSNELSRMQKDGILRCRRNHFDLLQPAALF